MNDFSDIESELKKLQPAPVEANLLARIEKALLEESSFPTAAVVPQRSKRANWISLGLGLGLAAAAGFFLLARVNDNQPANNQPSVAAVKPTPNERLTASANTINPGRMIPSGLTEVVYHTRDEGLHYPDGATEPMRRMRYHTRETLRWQNAQTGASLRVSYPSEEVVLLPVSGQ
jgi:hypothetical protein